MKGPKLPDTWKMVRLGTITEIVGGGTPPREQKDYFGGNIPWVTPGDLTKRKTLYIDTADEYLTDIGLKNSSAKLVPVGTVLMTSRATIAVTAIAKVPVATNQGFANFICDEELLFNGYLARLIPTLKKKFLSLAGGTTFPEIGRGVLSNFAIPLPPLAEQRRIVEILSLAEEIRDDRRHMLEGGWVEREGKKERVWGARDLLPALFQEMFGDPIRRTLGWTEEPFTSFAEVSAKLVDPRHLEYQDLVQVDGDSIEGGTGKLFGLKTVRESASISNKFLFGEQDVLYSKIRPILKKVGLPDSSGLCSADIYPITPNDAKVRRAFLAQLFLSNHFTAFSVRASERAQIPKINRDDLERYRTIIPTLETQEYFEKTSVEIDGLNNDLSQKFLSAQVLLQSISSDAFLGIITESWRENISEELEEVSIPQRQVERSNIDEEYLPFLAKSENKSFLHWHNHRLEFDYAAIVPTSDYYKQFEDFLNRFSRYYKRYDAVSYLSKIEKVVLVSVLDDGTYIDEESINSLAEEAIPDSQIYVTAEMLCDRKTFPIRDVILVRNALETLAAMGLVYPLTSYFETENGGAVYLPVFRAISESDLLENELLFATKEEKYSHEVQALVEEDQRAMDRIISGASE